MKNPKLQQYIIQNVYYLRKYSKILKAVSVSHTQEKRSVKIVSECSHVGFCRQKIQGRYKCIETKEVTLKIKYNYNESANQKISKRDKCY